MFFWNLKISIFPLITSNEITMRSVNVRVCLLILTGLGLLLACKKVNGGKSVYLNIRMVCKTTHLPIKCKFNLEYTIYKKYGGATKTEEINLGSTDEFGVFKKEVDVPSGSADFQLAIHPYVISHAHLATFYGYSMKQAVSRGKNEEMIELPHNYFYSLHLHNANCLNAQDSLLLGTSFALTGCVDTLLQPGFDQFYMISETPSVSIPYTVVRNGVSSDYVKDTVLGTEEQSHIIEIAY